MWIVFVLSIMVILQYLYYRKKLSRYKEIINIEIEIETLKRTFDTEIEEIQNNVYNESQDIIMKAHKDAKEEFRLEYQKQHLLLKFRSELLRKISNELKQFEQRLIRKDTDITRREENINKTHNEYVIKQKELDGYEEKKKTLKKEISDYELDIFSLDYGVYNFKYDFIVSKIYEDKIKEVRQKQKEMIKDKTACICNTDWTVGNSRREGQKMVNRNIRMMLRAFNGECDSVIANTTYKNINTMDNRIFKSFENINKLNTVLNSKLTYEYYKLKKDELFLVHEFNEKKYEEKEEQKIIKLQIKEEERAQKEFERELLKAEKEAEQYLKALEEARKEVKSASQNELKKLNAKILNLEIKLEEAEKNRRAISQAQITKCGYVYVISNIGSFGENTYKIGMTRRLEPLDRIRELNGPSVPYVFDVHAMIFSENAPELELKLHKELSNFKMNRVNTRKEFFNVALETIEEKVKNNCTSKLEFLYEHEAKEFRLSELIRAEE